LSWFTILGVLVFSLGGVQGWIRGTEKRKRLEKAEKEKSTGRRKRADVSEDAPAELSQAELEAMGRWFQE